MGKSIAIIVFVAACSNTGASLAPGDIEDYIADEYCHHLTRCGLFDSVDTCKSSRTNNLDANDQQFAMELAAAVDAGTVHWNGGDAAKCYAALLDPPSCDEDAIFLPVVACIDMMAGTVAADGTCTIDNECASQHCVRACSDGTECCAGTCAAGDPIVPAQLGETCRVTTGSVTMQKSCIDSLCGADDKCDPYAEAGDACSGAVRCHPGKDLECNSGTCAKSDGTCGQNLACPLLAQRCDDTAGTCATQGLPGAACAADLDCADAYRCDVPSGTCAERALVGEPCGTTTDCRDHGFCDAATGTCAPPKPDGAACTTDDECARLCSPSGTCADSSTCQL